MPRRRLGALTLLGGAARLGIGSVIGTAVAAVTTVLVASRLAPADWGNVATSMTWALAVSALVLFGLPQLLTREIAAGRMDRSSAWSGSATSALIGIPLTAGLLIILGLPGPLALMAGLLTAVVTLRTGTMAPLSVDQRFGWLGGAAVTERLIALAVVVLMLYLDYLVLALIVAQCVGLGTIAVLQSKGVVGLRRWRPDPPVRHIRYLRSNSAFGVAAMLYTVAQLDIVLVYVLAGEQESGFFGVASRLVLPLSLVGSVVSTVLLPRIAATEGALKVPKRFLVLLVLGTFVATIAGIALLSSILVPLLGAAYAPSVPVCVIYLVATSLVLFTQPLVAVAQGRGLERPVARLMFFAEIVHLSVAAAGALIHGALGAAFGYLAGNILLITCLIVVVVFRRRYVAWR